MRPHLLAGAGLEAPLVDDGAIAKWSTLVAAEQRQNSLECNPCINAEHGDVVGVARCRFIRARGSSTSDGEPLFILILFAILREIVPNPNEKGPEKKPGSFVLMVPIVQFCSLQRRANTGLKSSLHESTSTRSR